MPFRESFDCLWCGRAWRTGSAADLEGWAALCPDCLGRAQENEFIRFRLRAALRDRASATAVPVPGGQRARVPGTSADGEHAPVTGTSAGEPALVPGPSAGGDPARAPGVSARVEPSAGRGAARAPGAAAITDAGDGPPIRTDEDAALRAYYAARAPEYDDWYLRRGRYSRGPARDLPWHTELDQVTLWLDAQPIAGEIVEPAAGTGWWSALLAQKGTLWAYDAVPETLEFARRRLVAHGLLAHLHLRDAWAAPDRQVDTLFCGFWLSHVRRERLAEFLELCREWLRPGGRFVFVDSLPDPESGARDHDPVAADGTSLRHLADGREFRIPKIYYTPAELERSLVDAGFRRATVERTRRFFIMGGAER